ncbi:hypothetical protein BJY00DRAFT_315103 [Aspergillus carlsbadensis]|nr:hypothetical protein BJY00DRAFT_315103 [Aspergillus carlsbadensis]
MEQWQTVLKDPHFVGTVRLLARIFRAARSGSTPKIGKFLMDLVDKWATDKELNPLADLYSPEYWAEGMVCETDVFNEKLAWNYFDFAQEILDDSYREDQYDRFVVFHFHVHHMASDDDGVLRPGVYAMGVFHAQHYAGNGRYARVDGNDRAGYNQRAHIIECDPRARGLAGFWYPGDRPNGPGPFRQLTRFGNYLQEQRLMTDATFTAADRGNLGVQADAVDGCPVETFDWSNWAYRGNTPYTDQFGPDGPTPPRYK